MRRRPFAAYLVNGVAIYALIALGYPSDFYQWTNLIALFGAASRIDLRRAVVALVLGWAGVTFYFLRFPLEGSLVLAGAVISIWTAAWFAARAQFARVRELEVRRERDLTRADFVAQQARMELELERNRLARELHDIVGHAVNVMVVHAGAGRGALENDPSKARGAFDTISTTERAALADLDRMLDVLQRGAPGIRLLRRRRRAPRRIRSPALSTLPRLKCRLTQSSAPAGESSSSLQAVPRDHIGERIE